MIMRKSIQYLNKALELAVKDRDTLNARLDKYINVDTNKSSEIAENLKMRKDGYNINDEITKQVDLDVAISELEMIIFFEERRHE